MVPKPKCLNMPSSLCFRAVLFRMVPKLAEPLESALGRFRAVLFRMVPKPLGSSMYTA